ncbi:hypothetical protein AA23498_2984 [Acetobacter nitrogenifigens DSM 23921 = NBRC 105050]|uniref:Uncharacterized protein n=1 Tax=Acetobacter nitrogenifigens DSM 23921 = NBRC 105050 TaxID=1120919 RepID=A0A511XA31_9PROT|nr:hypothetical protein AA23498_2984 [Acetobacter nitrogenifigens DSM 23921 = NBRC 105050]GEN59810.1 hypothetical protein ANI02nite_16940 [Acetobacter nitrogenifigens DSM 23921 = NBRC 105050]
MVTRRTADKDAADEKTVMTNEVPHCRQNVPTPVNRMLPRINPKTAEKNEPPFYRETARADANALEGRRRSAIMA